MKDKGRLKREGKQKTNDQKNLFQWENKGFLVHSKTNKNKPKTNQNPPKQINRLYGQVRWPFG